MESKGIVPIEKRLGRPPLNKERQRLNSRRMHQRNEVEGTFGTVKMHYGAARIRTRLPETTEVAVAMSFLAKNVITFLRTYPSYFFPLFPSFFLQNHNFPINAPLVAHFFKSNIFPISATLIICKQRKWVF